MPSLFAHILLVVLAAAAQSAAPVTGRITGRIVDAGTGAPIAGVRVTLGPVSPTAPSLPALPPRPPQGRQTAPPPPSDSNTFLLTLARLTSETNADGIFEIRGVPNGRWATQVSKEGYVVVSFASMSPIEMVGGRSVTIPDVPLDRGGAISGRVLDARGSGMSGVTVLALNMRRLPNGTIQVEGSRSGSKTNDLGEYRLSGLAPGEHYVSAQPPPRPAGLLVSAQPPPSPTTHVATYYPGVVDAALASPVNVVRGGTTGAIDFTLQSVAAYQVSGIAVDSSGRPVAGAIVRLALRSSPMTVSVQGGPSDANGRFRVTNVPAGTYGVMAAAPLVIKTANGGMSSSLSFGEAARPGAAPELTIQADVTNLRVVVTQP
jgi:hypothetical protein